MSIRLERDFALLQAKVAKLEAELAELQKLIQAQVRQATPKGR